MANTEPTPATRLMDALKSYSSAASSLYSSTFDDAHAEATANLTLDQIQRAQGRNAAAFSQLVTAAKLESEQNGRAGYLAVVQLMQKTADTADKVCTKLVTLLHAAPGDNAVPQASDVPVIAAYSDALRALGELSPDAVWATPATSSNE